MNTRGSMRLGFGQSGLLVPWHAIERGVDLAGARALVQTALEDPEGAAQLRSLLSSRSFGEEVDDAALVERVADMIASGELVFVRLPVAMSGLAPARSYSDGNDAASHVPRLSDLLPPKEEHPPAVRERQAWIEIRYVGERGESYAGSPLRLRDPEGGTRTLILDDRSTCRVDDITTDGTCWAELDAAARPNGIAPAQQGVADPVARTMAGGEAVALRTTSRHTLVVVQPRTACVRLVGMLFELNKSFLLPAAVEGIRLLAHMYQTMPGAEILVVGHTDRTGKKYRNDSLSLERAEAVIAYMTDDVEAWYAFYTKDTDLSRRWDATEDLAMLAALPRGQRPYYSDEHEEEGFGAAVRRFQAANGLTVDGDPGPLTRRALIAEYMRLDGATLPNGTTATAHGCGEHFPVVPTDDDVEELQNRRVEVFFFADGIDPAPPSTSSKAGSTEYPAWNEAVEQERTFTPSLAGRGTLLIHTDLPEDHVGEVGMTFTLKSVDGSYEQTRDPAAAGVAADGYMEVVFEGVPTGAFLTLVATYANGHEQTLFADVPYDDLRGVSSASADDIVDPFTMETVR